MNNMQATYTKQLNKRMQNNPLIEAMGMPLLPKNLIKQCTVKAETEFELTSVAEDYRGYYQRIAIDELSENYVVQDEAPQLYETIFRMIQVGYVHRNPIIFDDFKQIAAIDELSKGKTQSHILKQTAQQSSFLLAGLSGRGKSAMVESLLSVIPQRIMHQSYTDSNDRKHAFNYEQITWLKVDVPTNKGQRALLWRILEALDFVTGENYYTSHEKSNVVNLMIAVRKALIIHGVGLIVLDEAQNLSKPSSSEKVGNNENATLKFVEELFNKIGVPLLLVGTLSTLTLFSQEMTSARRIAKNGSLILEECEYESSFWKRFMKQVCTTQLLQHQVTESDTVYRHIHRLSCGIPAVATSLIRSTLSYLTYLSADNQDMSIKALNHVFKKQFSVLESALNALKKGDYYKFEDCAPLSQLHSNEDYYSKGNTHSVVHSDESTSRLSSGNVKGNLTTKDNELLDKMSPNALLGKANNNE